ncbi:MAG: serine/threonine protein kinase [Deltaproteobacteria bacterium]|nr:serine/threonine protein kinase [Deltaproteobacteria bacterium]
MRFGRYLLDRRLAIGGMAEVFLGRIEGPEGFEKKVVIKRILPHLEGNPGHVQMFLDEARLAARLDHPHLVQVYELARIDNQYCLAMEYIEGADVATVLDECLKQHRRVPVDIAVRIAASAAEGLHYAHELQTDDGAPLNVVHRDISPANIIVTWRGGVKIVDFGIAKHEIANTHTMAGILKGKYAYMSPEQGRGETVDRRSDLFSLGTVLYEMLTVSPCFGGQSQIEILDAVIKARFRPVKELCPDLPASVERVLRRLLALHRDDRYKTAQALLADLRQILNEYNMPSATEVGDFLSDLFGRDLPTVTAVRIPTGTQRPDEVPVTDAFSSPDLIVDESSYKTLLARKTREDSKLSLPEATARGSGVFDIDPVLLTDRPKKKRRRSTLSKVADRLREPRYWPTTLSIIAVAMAVSALALAMIYRAALGLPWGPGDIFSELLSTAPPAPSTTEEIAAGALQVLSQPPGATVSIDGEPVEGQTPLTIDNLALGMPHHVVLSMAGYSPAAKDVSLSDASLQSMSMTLVRLVPAGADVEVEVTSVPSGAAVLLDGTDVARLTPTTLTFAAGSEHVVSARLQGYSAKEVKVVAKPDAKTSVSVPLTAVASEATGQLDLDSEPNAEVLVNERVVGSTPIRRLTLPAGPAIIKLRNSKLGVTKTLRLEVVAGDTVRRRVTFGKGQVVFDIKPWADVYLGGKKLGTTPMPPVSLYEGTYAVKLVNPELAVERVLQVTVRPGKSKRVTERLR